MIGRVPGAKPLNWPKEAWPRPTATALGTALVFLRGGLEKHDNVVHDAPIAGQALGGLHPFVLGKARVDDVVAIFHRAFGRHVHGLFAHVEHGVRPAGHHPVAGILDRLGQLAGVALRRAGGHPLIDLLLLCRRERDVVAEVPVAGLRVPGRHATVADDFLDHFGPAGRVLIVLQGERPDLARAMTFDAAVLKDPRDLIRIRDFRLGIRLAHATDQAADGAGLALADFLAGQQLVDSLG